MSLIILLSVIAVAFIGIMWLMEALSNSLIALGKSLEAIYRALVTQQVLLKTLGDIELANQARLNRVRKMASDRHNKVMEKLIFDHSYPQHKAKK